MMASEQKVSTAFVRVIWFKKKEDYEEAVSEERIRGALRGELLRLVNAGQLELSRIDDFEMISHEEQYRDYGGDGLDEFAAICFYVSYVLREAANS